MADDIIGVAMEHQLPAGALGPEAVTLDIRAYLVPHDSGLVLVDTGMEQTGRAIDATLAAAGAGWSDVSHVVITHGHPDHTGALDHARRSASDVPVFASPLEGIDGTEPLADGDVVGSLRAFATPGHTPGHMSLVDEDRGLLLIGDCLCATCADLECFSATAPRSTSPGRPSTTSLRRCDASRLSS
jgi:glyoxylase-like metal-dependent hydrolase (beta-lactamase superfamily II)